MAEAETKSTMKGIIAQDGACVLADVPIPEATGREILVKIHASALNRADTFQRKGSKPPPGVTEVMGLELAGEVVAVGPECSLNFAVGDGVMALVSGGGYAEYATVDERHAMPIPAGYSWAKAACIPETWLTAFQLLHFIADVKEGDVVLVHAAGSGVGTSATQLATIGAKATVIATAGSPAKLDRAASLGASAGFNYKEGPWQEGVRAAAPNGVNVILDCVGGSYWTQNAAVAATEAVWVVYGLLGGASVDGPLLLSLLRKRVRLEGTTLRARSPEYKARLVEGFCERALPLFSSGEYQPIRDARTFPLAQAQEAHMYMETNANIGKIVLLVSAEATAQEGAAAAAAAGPAGQA